MYFRNRGSITKKCSVLIEGDFKARTGEEDFDGRNMGESKGVLATWTYKNVRKNRDKANNKSGSVVTKFM